MSRQASGEGQTVGGRMRPDEEGYVSDDGVAHALDFGQHDVHPPAYGLHGEDERIPIVGRVAFPQEPAKHTIRIVTPPAWRKVRSSFTHA